MYLFENVAPYQLKFVQRALLKMGVAQPESFQARTAAVPMVEKRIVEIE